MPLLAVLFEDDPARAEEIRRKHMADHLAFLEKHAAMVRWPAPGRKWRCTGRWALARGRRERGRC